MKPIHVSVTGCALADCVYPTIDFNGPVFRRYASRTPGDGGLVPGQLVFLESLADFAGESPAAVQEALTAGQTMAARNVGGPAVVAAINAAQMLWNYPGKVRFYGACGDDDNASFIRSVLAGTPLDSTHYEIRSGITPATDVLSDPDYHDGKGERTFVNVIGAAGGYGPEALRDEFFDADVLLFGATALLPKLHDGLTGLLKRGKEAGRINMVATVFDFRNEQRDPVGCWPLGESEESYRYIDLLAVDWDEARRLSGEEELEKMIGFFRDRGTKSVVITHGAKDFYIWSAGSFFNAVPLQALPVNAQVGKDMAEHPESKGDTTGCGDNFAGGLLGALVMQLSGGKVPGTLDLFDAAAWAAASGGLACFTFGGTYREKAPGEKMAKLRRYRDLYRRQIGF